MTPSCTTPDPPSSPKGPYMLRVRGKYGFGKHVDIRIDAADVLDLGASPDGSHDPKRMDATSRTFVEPIIEDESPSETGLDVQFGGQRIVHTGGTSEVVNEQPAE